MATLPPLVLLPLQESQLDECEVKVAVPSFEKGSWDKSAVPESKDRNRNVDNIEIPVPDLLTLETSSCHLEIKIASEDSRIIRSECDGKRDAESKDEEASETNWQQNHSSVEVEESACLYQLPPHRPRGRSVSPKCENNLSKPYTPGSDDNTTTDDDEDNNPNMQSYVGLTLRRKTLLTIEKLTDSDSRSRGKMRSRGLSPPSSSDDENLYIGWVAYPRASLKNESVERGTNKPPTCACVHVFKQVLSPVSKVCKICKGFNKVNNGNPGPASMSASASGSSES